MDLLSLFRRFRTGIIIAIGLVVIENLAWIVEPTVFGNVIDAFIDRASSLEDAAFLLPLLIWVGVFLLNSVIGALRRSVDERIYLRMFTDIATEVARIAAQRDHSVSRTAARAGLSREYIAFFQYRIPEILEQAIAIGGAIVALFFFDWRIAATCAVIIVPLLSITRMSNRKILALQKELHDRREQEFDTFETKDLDRIRSFYTDLARPQQRIANWGAINFGIVRFSLLIIFVIVLYIAIDLDKFTTGNIYSIVAYLWTFVTSSEYLPELMESWTSLQDISSRVKADEE